MDFGGGENGRHGKLGRGTTILVGVFPEYVQLELCGE